MKIYLLTHPRELPKPTNTGKLVLEVLGTAARLVEWSRVEPDEELLNLTEQGQLALLYPGEGSVELSEMLAGLETGKPCEAGIQGLVVLDGTWQEARKIYNKSPYLHNLPRIALKVNSGSRYNLRRNQLEEGLCTAECVAHLLQALGRESEAGKLNIRLDEFIASNKC
ncbi:tRNA-uridine aminocarboxypropyltransferase [Aliamphritea ceti]|uniref:tRNA-uridine aminocarboxypropyltransferase n=1 Tax=Aliamphritea ceti TaxID=1524258 RepID=UPI0021C3632D|nr:tRNA-uridine aminocarboxypropyltransferase [Aliamphritea ceti]